MYFHGEDIKTTHTEDILVLNIFKITVKFVSELSS
jgi:hypothetical protein